MSPLASAADLWTTLDEPWRESFRQAWQALQAGTIAVGACAGDGPIIALVDELQRANERAHLASMEITEALGYLWPRLRALTAH